MKESTLQIMGLFFAMFWGCVLSGVAQFLFNPNIVILIALNLLVVIIIYYIFLRWMRGRK